MSTLIAEQQTRSGSLRWGAGLRGVLVAAALIALAARVGTAEVLDALCGLTTSTVLIALGLGAVATASSALRWRAVAAAVGAGLPLAGAWAAVYRATVLNSLLPGGFLGDLSRAMNAHHHADRRRTDPQQAARVVVLERAAGQVVVFTAALALVGAAIVGGAAPTLTTAALGPTPSGTATTGTVTAVLAPLAAIALAAVVAGLAATRRSARARTARGVGRARRQISALRAELRAVLTCPQTAVVVLASSLAGFAALLGTFALAADVVGVAAPAAQLVPLCTVGLLAMAVPINVGGWGPRELTLAAAFAAGGFGAPAGLAVSVLYGVLTLLGALPGALLLAMDILRRARRSRVPTAVAPAALRS